MSAVKVSVTALFGTYTYCQRTDLLVHGTDTEKAWQTLPACLSVRQSKIPGAGLGVWTNDLIRNDTRFGPYEGEITSDPLRAEASGYCWQIGRGNLFIDAKNQSVSNWLRYVNCCRNSSEQNLIAYQYRGQIFYRTIREIPANTELLVWYGDNYGRELGGDPDDNFYPRRHRKTIDVNVSKALVQPLKCQDQGQLHSPKDIKPKVQPDINSNYVASALRYKAHCETVGNTLSLPCAELCIREDHSIRNSGSSVRRKFYANAAVHTICHEDQDERKNLCIGNRLSIPPVHEGHSTNMTNEENSTAQREDLDNFNITHDSVQVLEADVTNDSYYNYDHQNVGRTQSNSTCASQNDGHTLLQASCNEMCGDLSTADTCGKSNVCSLSYMDLKHMPNVGREMDKPNNKDDHQKACTVAKPEFLIETKLVTDMSETRCSAESGLISKDAYVGVSVNVSESKSLSDDVSDIISDSDDLLEDKSDTCDVADTEFVNVPETRCVSGTVSAVKCVSADISFVSDRLSYDSGYDDIDVTEHLLGGQSNGVENVWNIYHSLNSDVNTQLVLLNEKYFKLSELKGSERYSDLQINENLADPLILDVAENNYSTAEYEDKKVSSFVSNYGLESGCDNFNIWDVYVSLNQDR